MTFPWWNLSQEDQDLAMTILGKPSGWRDPDLIIAPNGEPYLYRWHVIPHSAAVNIYFHIQIGSDPERPLHDHPWDNTTIVLSNGYDEVFNYKPAEPVCERRRILRKGDVVYRPATMAHRLFLPDKFLYSMTIFTTGPRLRDWGFWFPDGWRNADEVLSFDPVTRYSITVEGFRDSAHRIK